MAELLAVAGGISSFITIAEVALHLVQGCRQLIKDAKDAPKDVRKLVEELENLSNIAEGIERIVRETENEELRTKVDEAVSAALERCVGVVGVLNGILAEYEKRFQKSGAKLWWEKVKVVKGKKALSRILDDIERAKLSLVLAHQNALSITMQSQSTTLGTISQSVNLSRNENFATATKIDHSYNQGKEILTVARSTQQEIQNSVARQGEDSERQKAIQRKLETISESQIQSSAQITQSLERIGDSNMGMSTRIDNSFSQGEAILSITKRTEQGITESKMSDRENSERLQSMERQLEQLSSVMGSPGALVGILTQALDTHDRRHQRTRVEEVKPDIDDAVHCGNNTSLVVERSMPNGRRRARWKPVSYKCHLWNRYLDISSATREEIPDEDDSTQELASPKMTETAFTVRSTLPFLKRALYYTTFGTAWDPLYETKVRYIRVFTDDSPILKACIKCDLDKVRRLFASGEASPFMEHEWGRSLVDEVIQEIARKRSKITNDDVQLVDYLLRSCGRGGASVKSYTVWHIIYLNGYYNNSRVDVRHPTNWNYSSSHEGAANILRLVLEYSREDPLDHSGISPLIDLDHTQDSVVTVLIQQPFWSFNLRPALDDWGYVEENSRQILDDPDGEYLRELLEDANYYEVRTHEGSGKVFAGLFKLAAQTTSADLRECCKNRMKLLIGTPKFHRLMGNETLDFEDAINMRTIRSPDHNNNYVGRLAIRRGYRPLLEEVFQELGWSDFDIDDFFDKETFYGVPDLLDGEIVYETSQQTQQEFILHFCDGAFTELTENEIEALARQISNIIGWYSNNKFEDTIKAANIAFSSKSTPGSWPEEGKIRLVPGVDFVIPEYCKEYILSWYRDYVDPDFEFDLGDEDYDNYKLEMKRIRSAGTVVYYVES